MNILVIDDEKTILSTVFSQLKEMNLDVDKIDTAGSTREARKLMRENSYDIFLCDIVMPEEDGIRFAKWVLNRYPHVKFVFLTAHADFNYMREAIAMQSFDYLLQPADRAELRNVVERAISQIKLENKNKELLKPNSFLLNHKDAILENGAFSYCEGKQENDAYLRHFITAQTGSEADDFSYLPVLIEILKAPAGSEEIGRFRSIYQNISGEIIKPLSIKTLNLLNEDKNELLLLLCIENEEKPEPHQLMEKLENCRIFFQKLLQMTVALYCGEICDISLLQYNCQPLFQLEKDNIRKESRVFRSQRNRYGEMSSVYSFESQMFSWNKFLEQKQFDKFYESLFHHIDQYSKKNQLTLEYMVDLHQSVSKLILGYMVNHGIDSSHVFDASLPYLDYMQCWQDLEGFDKAIQHIIGRLYRLLNLGREDFIEDAIAFIRSNIDKELAVRELAQHIGVHPEYLTKLFKKRTGLTVKAYITNEKMEAAKMLLATTELPVTVIADHVGYGNYSNFTRTFKQLFGCTPVDYRKNSS